MSRPRHIAVFRWLALLSVIPVGCIAMYLLREEFRLQRLAEHDTFIRQLCQDHPIIAFAGVFIAFVGATSASIPAAAGMMIAVGWMFGFWPALILCSFGSAIGGCGAFVASRLLLRDAVRVRFAAQLGEIEKVLEQDGAFYLLLLRLIPVIPYFVINIVMGLTPIRLRTFWWVTQIGMLPVIVLYVAAGATVPTLQDIVDQGLSGIFTARIIAVFTALALMPLMARRLFVHRRAWKQASEQRSQGTISQTEIRAN